MVAVRGQGYPMVHPSLQDRDFELLQDGDPIFMNLEGGCKLFARSEYENIRDLAPPSRQQQLQNEKEVKTMNVSQTQGADSGEATETGLFPFFINEAAYYETNVAFSVAVMTTRELTVTSKDTLGEALPRL